MAIFLIQIFHIVLLYTIKKYAFVQANEQPHFYNDVIPVAQLLYRWFGSTHTFYVVN